MIEEFLQLRLDQALATCRQRWVLGGAAVLAAALGTVLALAGGTPRQGWLTMLAVTVGAAIVAVSASGTHVGAIVVAIVALQWLAFGGDETGVRSVGVALCLYAFHSITALTAASEGRLVPVPGGVLIKDADGATIGAVGISGDASDKDEYCAIAGIKEAALTPDPAEPDPNWREAGL